jgi:Protein-kinase domain of FAM69/N-term cysteine-rich ER, FAM69
MCSPLCIEKNLALVNCLNFKDGKVVFLMRYESHTVIMKSERARLSDYVMIGYRDISGRYVLPSVEEFYRFLSNAVYFSLKHSLNVSGDDLVNIMWHNPQQISLSNASSSELYSLMISISSLSQQNEYILIKYLKNHENLPVLYGSCGHFYVMEYYPTIEFITLMDDQRTFADWLPRAATAIQLLHLVLSFDANFDETLHLCDVKLNNFGVSYDGKMKAIDVDMVMFESELAFQFQNKKCSHHGDCTFLDCHGWCMPQTQTCWRKRTNNNLQVTVMYFSFNSINSCKVINVSLKCTSDTSDYIRVELTTA